MNLFRNHPKFFIILFFLLFGLASWYFFIRDLHNNSSPLEQIKPAPLTIVEKIGLHILLPEGEDPVVATVSDPKALTGQEFFSDAKKGDVVLIYNNAKRAILYRPSLDKIVNVSNFSVAVPQTEKSTKK